MNAYSLGRRAKLERARERVLLLFATLVASAISGCTIVRGEGAACRTDAHCPTGQSCCAGHCEATCDPITSDNGGDDGPWGDTDDGPPGDIASDASGDSDTDSATDADTGDDDSTPACGNGVVESGEACESGGCCNLSTCQLVVGTVCRASAGVCDVQETCSGASAQCPEDARLTGTVCRPSTGDCDAAELCTSSQAGCGADLPATNGSACDGGGCWSGMCYQRTTNGLVAAWDFEEAAGDVAGDISGMNPLIALEHLGAKATSWGSGSLSVGTGSGLGTSVPLAKLASAVATSDELTVELWLTLPATAPGTTVVIFTQPRALITPQLAIVQNGGAIGASLVTSASGGNLEAGVTTGSLTAGSTVHIVFTRSAGGLKSIYVNGVFEDLTGGTASSNLDAWPQAYAFLGSNDALDPLSQWRGSFHYVALYSRALTATEIENHYRASSRSCDDASRTWTQDTDGDGFGVADISSGVTTGCRPSATASARSSDCNDGSTNQHRGLYDVCGNGVDEDCSGGDSVCGAYAQVGSAGIVIEAEHWTSNATNQGPAWTVIESDAASGGTAVAAWPDSGVSYSSSEYPTLAPRLDYPIQFATAGTYYLWVRARASGVASQRVHFALDQTGFSDLSTIETSCCGGWRWYRLNSPSGNPAVLQVTATGAHTVNLYAREDGVAVDKLVLTLNSGFTPSDKGPGETTVTP